MMKKKKLASSENLIQFMSENIMFLIDFIILNFPSSTISCAKPRSLKPTQNNIKGINEWATRKETWWIQCHYKNDKVLT